MEFERRDIILAAASAMFVLGLSPFIGLAYAAAVAILMYFGTKVLVARRRRQILTAAGRGICAQCGVGLEGQKCPNCDSPAPSATDS